MVFSKTGRSGIKVGRRAANKIREQTLNKPKCRNILENTLVINNSVMVFFKKCIYKKD